MILESEHAPVHKQENCSTFKSDVYKDMVSILHAAETNGMTPGMLCLVNTKTGEIKAYTCHDIDGDKLIYALAKTISNTPATGDEDDKLHLTAVRSGERGN